MNVERQIERWKADSRAKRLEEDRMIAMDRSEVDCSLAIDRLEADCKLAAERLEADSKLAAKRLEADRQLELRAAKLRAAQVPLGGVKNLRKHGHAVDNKELMELILEMKRVFAECFEEKQGASVLWTELYEVFANSTTLSKFDKNYFRHYSKRYFLDHWGCAKCSKVGSKHCYVGVAAKK